MTFSVAVAPHPLLEVGAFVTRFDRSVAELGAQHPIAALAMPGARAPALVGVAPEARRTAVRDLLRAGGFKPAGRSKPASEYLVGARDEGRFPTINAAVDACNVVSLHSGLPISLVDAELLDRTAALRIAVAPVGTSYVFNPSGQVIDAGGLLALWDGAGPTGTPVKDAQRTKTSDGTRMTLAIVWGTSALPGHTAATTQWYRELVAAIPGALTEPVLLVAT